MKYISKSLLVSAILVCFTVAAPLVAYADTYVFEVVSESGDPKVDTNSAKQDSLWKVESRTTKTVRVGKSALEIASDKGRVIYDFDKMRVYSQSSGSLDFSSISLYAFVDFRCGEIQNRMLLRDILEKSGVAPANKETLDRFYSEAELGVVYPKSNSGYKLTKRTDQGVDSYLYSGGTVTEFKGSRSNLTAEQARQFSRFLIYDTSIHPLIRSDIALAGKVPDELKWVSFGAPQKERIRTSLKLQKFAEDKFEFELPEQSKLVVPPEDPLTPVFERLKQSGNRPSANLRSDAIQHVARYLQQHNYLDAYLTISEYSLQTGDLDPIAKFENLEPDADMKLFIEGMATPESKDVAIKALSALDKIDRTKHEKSYLLDLFRANLILRLVRSDASFDTPYERNPKKAFLKVLEINPYLSGAYHDLGDYFRSTWDQPYAWECYDQARKFYPNHFLLKQVSAAEKALQKNVPQFFEGDSVPL